MDVLTSETCWTLNNEIIKQVTSSWSLFIQLSYFLRFICVSACRFSQFIRQKKNQTAVKHLPYPCYYIHDTVIYVPEEVHDNTWIVDHSRLIWSPYLLFMIILQDSLSRRDGAIKYSKNSIFTNFRGSFFCLFFCWTCCCSDVTTRSMQS